MSYLEVQPECPDVPLANMFGSRNNLASCNTTGLTTRVSLPTWKPNPRLEPGYARLLRAIVEHKPPAEYSVILHGSALWGDRSNLRTGLPISDVDVLVIGNSLSELSAAASALRSIAQSYGVSTVPLFKLSAKFRTIYEIGIDELSANELGAMMHGCVLVGPSRFEIMRPVGRWFYSQANLSVATRLIYVAEQQRKIVSSKYEPVLSRYLAARLVLDIPTVSLLLRGITGLSYTYRVNTFSRWLNSVHSEFAPNLQGILITALKTKRDPEGHHCMDISAASNLLLRFSRALGLTDPVPQNATEFWRDFRPLDLRDRMLWKVER